MKFFKSFLLYFAIIIGSIVAIALVLLAVMYFAPGTEILGYEYINYHGTQVVEYNTNPDSPVQIQGIEAVEVNTALTGVYFTPSTDEAKIVLSFAHGMSGFVKATTSNLEIKPQIIEKTFSEEAGGATYKTLVIDIIEPQGVVATNNPVLTVFIPANLSVLSANTAKGPIGYNAKNGETVANVGKIYANASDGGNILIRNPINTTNYYFYSSNGEVAFENPQTISADIKFTTDTGTFNMTGENALLQGDMQVWSYVEGKGPTINFGAIDGDFSVVASQVQINGKRIGNRSAQGIFAITTDKSTINVGEVYARLSMASKANNTNNNVTVTNLFYDASTDKHIFDTGSGHITIENLVGDAGFDTTSGNVTINNAYNDIDIATDSGYVKVCYNPHSKYYEEAMVVDGDLVIDTKDGGVEIYNMRGRLDAKATSIKAKSLFKVHFIDVKKDSVISAGSRDVQLLVSYETSVAGGGIFRLLLRNGNPTVGLVSGLYSVINEADNDYVTEGEYSSQYRIGYSKDVSDAIYNEAKYEDVYGKVVVETTGKVSLNG